MSRLRTGITGVDELLDGGIPQGHSVLVSGKAGTGKTTFSSQFLYNGAAEYGERGAFFTMEESVANIKDVMRGFGYDFDALGEAVSFDETMKQSMQEEQTRAYRPHDILDQLEEKVEAYQPDRLVLDSLTKISVLFDDTVERRERMVQLVDFLDRSEITALLISEVPSDASSEKLSRYSLEEFVTDGVIRLGNEKTGSTRTRTIEVFKMRGVNHSPAVHPLKITDNGIQVYPKEEAFEN